MLSFNESRILIDNEIRKITLPDTPAEIYTPIEYVLTSRGKRLRPALILMVCELFSGDFKKAVKPAIGIEIFHNFTLLHDDIMDKSPIRRNKPTVHKKWNENIAILSGDLMSFLSYNYISQCDTAILPEVIDLFTNTAIKVCEGQQFDMNFESYQTVTANEYLNMIKLKTAVLIASSIKLGALIGGADQADSDLMYDFGINLGLAFQIQDDLLDVYSDVKTFGKKPGADIVANKKTYLMVKALESASTKQKEILIKQFNTKKGSHDKKIKVVKKIYDDLKIKKISEDIINQYFNKAFEILGKIDVPNKKKVQLINLAESIIKRKK